MTETVKNIRVLIPLSVTDLLKICEEQNNLLNEEDAMIFRLLTQLSEYEQELHDKDIYIERLENKLRQTWNTSDYSGKVLW